MYRVACVTLALAGLVVVGRSGDVQEVQCSPDGGQATCESSEQDVVLLQTDLLWKRSNSPASAGVATVGSTHSRLAEVGLKHQHEQHHALSGDSLELLTKFDEASAESSKVSHNSRFADGSGTARDIDMRLRAAGNVMGRSLQLAEITAFRAGASVSVIIVITSVVVLAGCMYMIFSNKGLTLGAVMGSVIMAATSGVVVSVAVAMFANVDGGGQAATSWIAWHAVLMALAYPGLMTVGRWVYMAEDDFLERVLEDKPVRRRAHRAVMTLAVLAAVGGYACIFKSHFAGKKYFAYDFINGEWAAPARILHVYLGYVVILASVAQAIMGALKMDMLLSEGERRIFTFHGTLGKSILLGGGANVVVAAYFWGWSLWLKIVISALAVVCVVVGASWQRSSAPGIGKALM